MKNILALIATYCFVCITSLSFAQDSSSDQIIDQNEPVFECKTASINHKKDITTFYDNASVKTNTFECIGANKIVYYQKTNKLIIYDYKSFTIEGKVVTKNGNKKRNKLKYTVGEDTAYLF